MTSAPRWWPEALGEPSSTGSQDGTRYAYFDRAHRLAVEQDGRVTLHDTGRHRIDGFSQQQGGERSLRFSSGGGDVALSSLPVVR